MKKILIYTNFDQESRHAIQYGVELALKENLGVVILHVINTAHYGPGFMATGDEFTGSSYISTVVNQNTILAKLHFREIRDELKTKYPRLPDIHTLLKTGIDIKEIVEETSKQEVMMLILPGYGKGAFLDFIIDIRPVVIKEAECPVLMIPETVKFRPYKKIIYATDFEQEDLEALKKLAEIANPFKAGIIAVHVTDNNDFSEKIREEGFNELIREKIAYDNIAFHSLKSENIDQTLMDFSEDENADIIAILRENRSMLEKIFRKSISKSFVKGSKIPVMIFHKHLRI